MSQSKTVQTICLHPSIKNIGAESNSVTYLESGTRIWIGGRSETSEIPLNDTVASRKHFEIRTEMNKFFVRDLGSSNGTLLNGQALRPFDLNQLTCGDVIQVGKQKILFELHRSRLGVAPRENSEELQFDSRSVQELAASQKMGSWRREGITPKQSWFVQLLWSFFVAP